MQDIVMWQQWLRWLDQLHNHRDSKQRGMYIHQRTAVAAAVQSYVIMVALLSTIQGQCYGDVEAMDTLMRLHTGVVHTCEQSLQVCR